MSAFCYYAIREILNNLTSLHAPGMAANATGQTPAVPSSAILRPGNHNNKLLLWNTLSLKISCEEQSVCLHIELTES